MIDRQAVRTSDADFRSLVEENKKQVYYLALRLTGNHHDAEDLSQEVFIKAMNAMENFRGESAASTWLHRITVNTYLNRSRKKSIGRLLFFGAREDAPATIDERPGPDVVADATLLQRYIRLALERLAPRERSAFVLRHYHELTIPEIAETMSVADGTIKSLLFRATRKMRDTLRPYLNQPGDEDSL